jgi:hypothetical protein
MASRASGGSFSEVLEVLEDQGTAHHGPDEDQARETPAPAQGVLHRQQPAPRVPQKVDPVQTEFATDPRQLAQEEIDAPRPRVAGAGRVAAAELVVEHDRASAIRQGF